MANLSRRVVALLLVVCAGVAGAQIAIPTLGSRGEIAPAVRGAFDELLVRFTEELRSAVAEQGLDVSRAELITPGIAGSLDPEYAKLIAELDRARYAVSGEIAVTADPQAQSPYVVNMIVVDAELDRATDLISRPLAEGDLRRTAVSMARLIVRFAEQALPLPGGDAGLFVSSQPGEAEVHLNGVRVGSTPALDVLMLAPGRYQLELRKEGFLPEVRTVELRPGATTFAHVQLAAIDGGAIQVVSSPTAEVFIGGLSHGFTPLFIPAPPGVQTIRLERDGFEPAVTSVPVRNYRTSRVDLQLVPEREPLLFWDVEREYLVYVDGEYQRGSFARDARPGLLNVEVRRGREERRYRVVLPARGAFELDLETGRVVPLER